VTIERVNAATIRNSATTSYYDVVANLKGVDMVTSSFTFKTPSTRGFNGSGNLRFNQFVDGMDNQAPGLNFSVGSIIGLTDLDVESMELLAGASSALYGSGGLNGTLLINSKNPFKYQGFSAQVRGGVMHVDGKQRSASPYTDIAIRWGKKLSDKFAIRLSSQYMKAQDWQANDKTNLARNNVISSIKPGTRESDPNYDGVNVFGDEVSASMNSFSQAVLSMVPPEGLDALKQIAQIPGITPQQFATIVGSNPQTAPLLPAVPFYLGYGGGIYGNQSVSRTGYDEQDLVDYESFNFKISGGLYYKLSENTEASLTGNWGTGTSVYTGADRYSLQNLKMGQYKLEFKGKNWFLRGYTTQENSGDSYAPTINSIILNRTWKSDETWLQQYTGVYSAATLGIIPNPQAPGTFLPPMAGAEAHAFARTQADQGRYLPGTTEFKNAFDAANSKSIGKGGSKFADKTDLYHFEGQYRFTDIQFAEITAGASFRKYVLNSQGTIFVDTAGTISINEYGAYLQAQKLFFDDVLKITASLRYDKNENFDGRFTPRVTGVIKVAKDNNIRVSYQTAYRFPSAQDQYINLQTPGSLLIGGLPQFNTFFRFDTSPAYKATSVVAFREAAGAQPTPESILQASALLEVSPFTTLKPETVESYELGYKGLIGNRLLIDVYGYYSRYKDFIARVAVGRGESESIDPKVFLNELYSPFTTNNYSFVTNSPTPVKAIGWGLSLQYQLKRGYNLMGNVYGDKLKDVPEGLITFFNTPKLRFNIGLGNDDISKGFGFNFVYKWQDEIQWEGTFGTGNIPAYGVLDGQISYKLPKIKSQIKLGATNITNSYYRSAFGNPEIGGLYYVGFAYNVL
jgi:outer membrane receptor protein involved in Fe transport